MFAAKRAIEKRAQGHKGVFGEMTDAELAGAHAARAQQLGVTLVTLDELNAVLPSEETSPEQIEDIMAMLNEMGINVVEPEEASEEGAAEGADEADEEEGGDLVEASPRAIVTSRRFVGG